MQDLIDALTIFLKYTADEYPTSCSHDKLSVMVDPEIVSSDDIAKLEDLGFHADKDKDESRFYSFRFGSC